MKGYEDLVKLIKKVQSEPGHVLDLNEAAICDYQDMIGHSTEEQLKELANGTYKETFYRVYGVAAGTVEAIRFFGKNSNKIYEILLERDEAIADRDEALEKIAEEKRKAEQAFNTSCKFQASYSDTLKEKQELEKKLEAAQDEIIKLKARLFDLMEK